MDGELSHHDLLKIFAFSFLVSLNLFGSFCVSLTVCLKFVKEPGAVINLFVRILLHFYINLKTSQYVLNILMLHFTFNGLNNVMITK